MLHLKILNEVSKTLMKVLLPLENESVFGIHAETLARNHRGLGLRVDLSKSAARLRRRLYAMWRSPLALHEFVALTSAGWGIRPQGEESSEVGDLVLDQMKLMSTLRGLSGAGGEPMSVSLRVDLLCAILEGLSRATKNGPKDLGFNTLAVLWGVHGLEGAKFVKKLGLETSMERFFRKSHLPELTTEELEQCLQHLTSAGFLEEEEGKWRLLHQVKFGF
jgi:hypothetical protein